MKNNKENNDILKSGNVENEKNELNTSIASSYSELNQANNLDTSSRRESISSTHSLDSTMSLDDVPILLQSLNVQINQLQVCAEIIGTDKDTIKLRRRINLHSDVSLRLLRKIHMISSNDVHNFKYADEYNAILTMFDNISKIVQKKLKEHPENGLKKISLSRDDSVNMIDTMREEEEDELVQLLDSFHEEDEVARRAKKWTTWGIVLGGSLLGAAIGGPIGGYAFYAGAGSLGACLGLGLGGGAVAGMSGTVGIKKLQSWTSKTLKAIQSKKEKKE